jgi:hypothetical protein
MALLFNKGNAPGNEEQPAQHSELVSAPNCWAQPQNILDCVDNSA